MTPSGRLGVGVTVALAVIAAFAPVAEAHVRSQSRSDWTLDGGRIHMTFTVATIEVTRLSPEGSEQVDLDARLAAHLRDTVAVRLDGTPCPPVGEPRPLSARTGFLRAEWSWACGTGGAVEIAMGAFFPVTDAHVHLARVRVDGSEWADFLFTERQQRHVVSGSIRTPASPVGAYVVLGVDHILSGLDHLAFLLALLLLGGGVRRVAWMVTGFTVGHSLTLSLAVLGVVEPNLPVIEALIGFTIALVAAENVGATAGINRRVGATAGSSLMLLALFSVVRPMVLPVVTIAGLALFSFSFLRISHTPAQAARMRPVLTVLFGLIHGFGFASALLEIGLPQGRLAASLFGFNLGVELGQLAIVALLVGLAVAVRTVRPGLHYRPVFQLASVLLCALGTYWFISRGVLA